MMALYRSGRQAEALDVYSQARDRLLDELGVEPGPALQRMQRAVLAQHLSLHPQPGDVAGMSAPRSRVPGTATRLIWSRPRGASGPDPGLGGGARRWTLIGPPGAGKTRLALGRREWGRRRLVWYVDVEHLPLTLLLAAAVLDVVAPSSRPPDPSDGLVDPFPDATRARRARRMRAAPRRGRCAGATIARILCAALRACHQPRAGSRTSPR